MLKKFRPVLFCSILFLVSCQIPHNFYEDPDGYSEFERCGMCGMIYEEGWHLSYKEHDPDAKIEAIEASVESNP